MNAVLYLLFWALKFAVQVDSTPDASEDSKDQGASCADIQCDSRGTFSCYTSSIGDHKCICNAGYSGRSCKQCARGFHEKFSTRGNECVKCKCNSSGTKYCDKQRGTCMCKENFKGKRCEQCLKGHIRKLSFKGELLECIAIIPSSPVISSLCGLGYQLINYTTLSQDDIQYECKRTVCECYGHSSTCTEDLVNCTNCEHNTSGKYCHQCKPGYYGNAMKGTPSDCQKCPCGLQWSNGRCYRENSGYLHCESCKPGHTGRLCDKCQKGWYGDLSVSGAVCHICNCSGNLQLDMPSMHICDEVNGKCLKCPPNTTGKNCETCAPGYIGDAVVAKNCTSLKKPLVNYSAKSQKVKEHAVIGICSTIGLVSLFVIGFVLYHKKSFKKVNQSLWTVEMSNRSYDDLDFSLLDPVSDTPYVYRTDLNDYEEDALLPTQKSQLVILHQEVGTDNSGAKQLDTVM